MKILVLSDTHGITDHAEKLIKNLDPDYTFHLGDVVEDCQRLEKLFPQKIITSVLGNNDFFDTPYPFEITTQIGGKTLFACHGHKYHVKLGLATLRDKADEVGADIVLYGHTHIPFIDVTDNRIIMNPGSIYTYGIIEIKDGKINASIEKYE